MWSALADRSILTDRAGWVNASESDGNREQSEATYYHRIEDLRALATVERDEGGVWRVLVEPWWAAGADTDEPYLEGTESMRTTWTTEFPEDLMYEIALRRGCEKLDKIRWSDPDLSFADIGDAFGWLDPWIPWVRTLLEPPPQHEGPRDHQAVVHLGDPAAILNSSW